MVISIYKESCSARQPRKNRLIELQGFSRKITILGIRWDNFPLTLLTDGEERDKKRPFSPSLRVRGSRGLGDEG